MPYRRYVLYMGRSPVTCAHCGTEVRLRHFRALVYGSLAGGAVLGLAVVLLASSPRSAVFELIAVGLLVLPVDYWSWRALPWDPAQPSEAPASPAPAS